MKPVEEAPAGGANAWQAAGSAIKVTLRLARPVVPPWSPPPKPAKTLLELIPPRDLKPRWVMSHRWLMTDRVFGRRPMRWPAGCAQCAAYVPCGKRRA